MSTLTPTQPNKFVRVPYAGPIRTENKPDEEPATSPPAEDTKPDAQ